MEERFAGEGEVSRCRVLVFSELKRLGDAGSRPCQKSRGDALLPEPLKGDGSKGDESPWLKAIAW